MTEADKLANDIEKIASEYTERKQPTGIPDVKETHKNFTKEPVYTDVEFYKEPTDVEQTKIKDKPQTTEISGKAGAFLAGGTIELLFGVCERVVFLSKFSTKEKQKLITLEEKSEAEYDNDDINLNRKFLAVTKKHDKIREKIPLSDDDMKALEECFKEYSRITGKEIPPALMIAATLSKVIVNRAMEIFL